MAEPATQPVRSRLAVGAMLRALAGSAELDASTLACLAGHWADGPVLIGWQPARVIRQLPPAPEPAAGEPAGTGSAAFGGGWIGCLDFTGTGWFGFFDPVLRRDRAGDWWLASNGRCGSAELARLACVIEAFPDSAPARLAISELAGLDRQRHLAAVEHAISAIRAGQLYQVNICARLHGRLAGSAIDLFAAGLAELAPGYAALLRTPARTVVSMSPELFLDRRGGQLRTAPIKGTRRRDVPAGELTDPAARELLHSDKDRAENVMIVDLMRNDLARVCTPGSVRAAELLAIRPAPGVWHLVSEVTGQLRPAVDTRELLAATFPPGSVTGAPKLRALQLIGELEPVGRGLFTGAIGYLSPTGDRSEFSVAIRTFEITGDRWQLGVGGGITADSVPMLEWQECLIKAAPLLALAGAGTGDEPAGQPIRWPAEVDLGAGIFETMLAVDGNVPALADHLGRLGASYLEVYGRRLPAELAGSVLAAVAGRPGRHRVRLTVRPDGSAPLIELAPATEPAGAVSVYRAGARTGSWRHKWADRRWLAGLEGAGTLPLFSTVTGDLVETSRSNLAVVPAAGVLRTPVLDDQLLPGITRRRLLDAAVDHGWRIELDRIGLTELRAARLAVSLSSISGLVAIDRLDGDRLPVDLDLLAELRGWLG